MEIIKILTDIRYPLNDDNIEKALIKVKKYNFNVTDFLTSINTIKDIIKDNS